MKNIVMILLIRIQRACFYEICIADEDKGFLSNIGSFGIWNRTILGNHALSNFYKLTNDDH